MKPSRWTGSDSRVRGPLETQAVKILQATATELRKRGITRTRWAMAAGMDRGSIWKILRRRRPMRIETLDRLLEAAAVLTDYSLSYRMTMKAT